MARANFNYIILLTLLDNLVNTKNSYFRVVCVDKSLEGWVEWNRWKVTASRRVMSLPRDI